MLDNSGKALLPSVLRSILILTLFTVLLLEGYYIAVLRTKMLSQREALSNISVQLQTSKIEQDNLLDVLSKIKQPAGDDKDEHTSDRQY